MKKEEKFLLRCLQEFLAGNHSTSPQDEEFPWNSFINLVRIHGLGGMVYLAVRNSDRIPSNVMTGLKHQFDFAVTHAVRRDVLLCGIEEALNKASIYHIYFKGYEISRYYPVPEVRMMSDVDMLVRKEDGAKIEIAMKKCGCVLQNKGYKGYVYIKDSLLLEVHTAFGGEPENGADFRNWISSGFENAVFEENGYTGYFRPSYHFIYLVYHAAKHFNSAGAGVRMFLDLAVFWNRYKEELDFKDIREKLEEINLDIFARTAFWLCNQWFGTAIPWESEPEEELRKNIEDYVFSGGVYGHHKRSVSDIYLRRAVNKHNEGNKRQQKFRVMLHYFFPNRKQMEGFLPAVSRYPFLLPVAWIIRGYQGFFKRKNHSLRVLRGIEEGNTDAEKEYKMLKRLGLWR